MNHTSAFVQGAPLPSFRRTYVTPQICMCQDPGSDSKQHDKSPGEKKKPLKTIKSNATWAANFFPDFGRKGPGSDPEWDLRPMSLRKVEEGKGICDSCRGTGAMTCTFCMGVDNYNYDGSLTKCPACDGKKTVTCSVCFGTKKQVELAGNWWERGIAALFKD